MHLVGAEIGGVELAVDQLQVGRVAILDADELAVGDVVVVGALTQVDHLDLFEGLRVVDVDQVGGGDVCEAAHHEDVARVRDAGDLLLALGQALVVDEELVEAGAGGPDVAVRLVDVHAEVALGDPVEDRDHQRRRQEPPCQPGHRASLVEIRARSKPRPVRPPSPCPR